MLHATSHEIYNPGPIPSNPKWVTKEEWEIMKTAYSQGVINGDWRDPREIMASLNFRIIGGCISEFTAGSYEPAIVEVPDRPLLQLVGAGAVAGAVQES